MEQIKITVIATTCAFLVAIGGAFSVLAKQLDVPVMERADLDLDTCSLGEVTGLNPDGDNFLAVRSGPGSSYRLIDKIHTGNKVWLFDRKGSWIGIAYGVDEIDCSPIESDRAYNGPGKKGWVYEKYVRIIAG